jgi:hypothetical protein
MRDTPIGPCVTSNTRVGELTFQGQRGSQWASGSASG